MTRDHVEDVRAQGNDVANRVRDAKGSATPMARQQRKGRLESYHPGLCLSSCIFKFDSQCNTYRKAEQVAETEASAKAPHALGHRQTGARDLLVLRRSRRGLVLADNHAYVLHYDRSRAEAIDNWHA